MKFFCVSCDEQMRLESTEAQAAGGGLSIVFRCSQCGFQTAMRTNHAETQLVSSLGLALNPEGEPSKAGSKCPFSQVAEREQTKQERPEELVWSVEAEARLDRVPEFVRPMAKMGIEKFAKDKGHLKIDEAVLEEARDLIGL